MFQSFFTQSQQMVAGWAKVARAELERVAASADALTELHAQGVARATEGLEEAAKLAKSTLGPMQSLPAEWRRLWVTTAERGIDAVSPAP